MDFHSRAIIGMVVLSLLALPDPTRCFGAALEKSDMRLDSTELLRKFRFP